MNNTLDHDAENLFLNFFILNPILLQLFNILLNILVLDNGYRKSFFSFCNISTELNDSCIMFFRDLFDC